LASTTFYKLSAVVSIYHIKQQHRLRPVIYQFLFTGLSNKRRMKGHATVGDLQTWWKYYRQRKPKTVNF